MGLGYYRLTDDKRVVPAEDDEPGAPRMHWQRVDDTQVGMWRVSTVFLSLDHSFAESGPPVVFETMVFGPGEIDQNCERYCTWDEAVAGHKAMVERVRELDPVYKAVKEARER